MVLTSGKNKIEILKDEFTQTEKTCRHKPGDGQEIFSRAPYGLRMA